MEVAAANQLLRGAARLRLPLTLGVESLKTSRGALLDELYDFSKELSHESRGHWQTHVDTCDEVHVFREATSRRLAGFQLWRFGGVVDKAKPIVWGGKLRFGPQMRRAGLQWMSNLVAFDSARAVLDGPIYRVGLVNVHGWLALAPALKSAQSLPLDGPLARVVGPELEPFCGENSFVMRRGRVDVGQTSPRSPDDFAEDWWSRAAINDFRTASLDGGRRLSRAETLDRQFDAFLCWEWDQPNVDAMHDRLVDKLNSPPPSS